MPGSALEAVAGDRSRVLGGDCSPGRLPCSLPGLSSSPFSHSVIVSDVPGRLSSSSSLAARGRGDACQRSLRNRPRSGSRLLQSPFPGGEGLWWLVTRDRSLSPEQVRPADSAPPVGVWVQLCHSTSAGGAVALGAATAIPAGVSDPPSAPAAVPGVSGCQQRQEDSRPSRRRHHSFNDGTDRRSKKRPRGRSPSPSPSSRRRERHYHSSSLEDDGAEASPPKAGRAPGGTPGDFRSAPAGDRSPRPRPSGWTSSSGAGRRSPSPSGGADDDRSSAFDTVDFDRDDTFWSVLGLIRNFHAMEEPAGIPSTRCKTSLASIYWLMSETSPAFHLPVSPLVRSLLDDANLALSKFLEDQTVHGFLPVPGRRH